MKLFVRQSFTQADETQRIIVQGVLDVIKQDFQNAVFLTGEIAAKSSSFMQRFEQTTGRKFTPESFRKYRLSLIEKCDAMVFIRTSMSESGAFELAYNLHAYTPKPVFYAHWRNAPIKTTLLRKLDEDYDVSYCEFSSAKDIRLDFRDFVDHYALSKIGEAVI